MTCEISNFSLSKFAPVGRSSLVAIINEANFTLSQRQFLTY